MKGNKKDTSKITEVLSLSFGGKRSAHKMGGNLGLKVVQKGFFATLVFISYGFNKKDADNNSNTIHTASSGLWPW